MYRDLKPENANCQARDVRALTRKNYSGQVLLDEHGYAKLCDMGRAA